MASVPERFLDIFMDQNNKCNLRCRMCGFSDPRVKNIRHYDMPFWLYEKIAQETFPFAKYVALSCLTEPLMTHDLLDRIDLAKKYQVPFTEMISNGTMLKEKIIAGLLNSSLTRLGVSLDGARASTYEAIRTGAHFEDVVGNIRRFVEMRAAKGAEFPKLRLLHVISERNVDEFSEFLDLAESLKVDAIDVRTITGIGKAELQPSTEESFWEKIRAYRSMLAEWTEKSAIEDTSALRYQSEEIRLLDSSGEKLTCRRPWNTLAIHANGNVHPCMSWSRGAMGNLADENFDQIWKGQRFEDIREEFAVEKPGVDCQHCVIKKAPSVDEDTDFFFKMLNSTPPQNRSGKA
ncbi:radical SAM domain protein [delta proteobacterium NaphS2]|nr:radical SAM domain protein [delta proteobacterium NaphS2]